jgi:hypothetical protein
MKRRALVLTDEAAGHPFRRTLPAHVLETYGDPITEKQENEEAARKWRLIGSDWRGFLAAYCATFVAVFTFIA